MTDAEQSNNSEVLEFPREYFQELVEKARLRMRVRTKRFRKHSENTSLADRIISKTPAWEDQKDDERYNEEKIRYRLKMTKEITRQIRRQMAMEDAAASAFLDSVQKAKDRIRKIHEENQRDEQVEENDCLKNNISELNQESDNAINKKPLKHRKRKNKTVTFSSDGVAVYAVRSPHSSLGVLLPENGVTGMDDKNDSLDVSENQDSGSDQNVSRASDEEEELGKVVTESEPSIGVTHTSPSPTGNTPKQFSVRQRKNSLSPGHERRVSNDLDKETKSDRRSSNLPNSSVIKKSTKAKIPGSTQIKLTKNSQMTNQPNRKPTKSVIETFPKANDHYEPLGNVVQNKPVNVRHVESPIKEYINSRQTFENESKENYHQRLNNKSTNSAIKQKENKSNVHTYKGNEQLSRWSRNTRRILIRNKFYRTQSCDRYLISDVNIQNDKAMMQAERKTMVDARPRRSSACETKRHHSQNKLRVYRDDLDLRELQNEQIRLREWIGEPNVDKSDAMNEGRMSSHAQNSTHDTRGNWRLLRKYLNRREDNPYNALVTPNLKLATTNESARMRKVYTPEIIAERERKIADMRYAYRPLGNKRNIPQSMAKFDKRPSQRQKNECQQSQNRSTQLKKYVCLPPISSRCSIIDGNVVTNDFSTPNRTQIDKQVKQESSLYNEKPIHQVSGAISTAGESWHSPLASPRFLPSYENSPVSSNFSDQNDSAYSSIVGDNNYEGSDNHNSSHDQFLSLEQREWDTPLKMQQQYIGSEKDNDRGVLSETHKEEKYIFELSTVR